MVELADGIVTLDGTNSFSIPSDALGGQDNYTIEFEVKRATQAHGGLRLVSNMNTETAAGLSLKYFPPAYNAGLLSINGHRAVEQRGFLRDDFSKITLAVKERKLALFRDGLILAVTDAVQHSDLPLTFGDAEQKLTTPYSLRNIKIHKQAVFPDGFDENADRMRYFSGEGYAMQRVEIEDPSLPRILVVGDSISMGYRRSITEHFRGKAYVDYWVGGSWFDYTVKEDDFPALRAWEGVLANGPYAVVTWNAMTLHMWNGSPGRVDEAKYPSQMTRVVEHLRQIAPETHFIWVRCTPWRTTPESGRPSIDHSKNARIVRLNQATDTIMDRYRIPKVDAYTICEARFDTVSDACPDAVHWPAEVNLEIGRKIIYEIEDQFTKMQSTSSK